ncbi:cell division protein ZapA [Caloranaerobacter azorensis]|uniref:Cell division protein ZapA n=3 Tax=Caloranaerobacter azorensis TaxID=116090 RepID=A0A6P1YH23_9FIRM|nr:cell division protein ZapA [Caloranaerobacter azorensis]QIB27206.1 cell division protein ZapA [Caloranaerobacter azorensis]
MIKKYNISHGLEERILMGEKKKVTIRIRGQEYTVIGEESEEYIKELGNYVDNKIKDILEKNSKLNQTMAATLAAFTIADELYKIRKLVDSLNKIINEKDNEIEEKLNIIKGKETEIEDIKAQYEELNNKINDYQKKIKKYEHALDLKEKELQNTQKIITELQNKLYEKQIELVQAKKELEEFIKTFDTK